MGAIENGEIARLADISNDVAQNLMPDRAIWLVRKNRKRKLRCARCKFVSTAIESPLQQPGIFERSEPAMHGWLRHAHACRQFGKRRRMLHPCDGFEQREWLEDTL